MSIDPTEIGQDMPRKVELDGNLVTLTSNLARSAARRSSTS